MRRAVILIPLLLLPGCGLVEHYLGDGTPSPVRIAVAWRAPTIDGHRVRRVVVLPFRDDTVHPESADGAQHALIDALNRRQPFEVVALDRSVFTARDEELWSTTGRVKKDTILRLSRRYHADGVLYGTVTRFRPYEPMTFGLRIALVSTGAGDLIWEANALYDAQDARVAQDVHHWYDTQQADSHQLESWRSVLMSPTRFIGYACARIVETW
ncbi:MAG: hypothetical protein CMJ83_11175 [Planctomycetes bacterium]|nr:hypothetical protein [Planctomycetota bacterium]